MPKQRLIFLFSLILLVLLFFRATSAQAATFDPNNIISDAEIMNSSSMTLDDIIDFLKSKNSYLSTYRIRDVHGDMMSAAEIIYNAAVNNYDCEGIELSASPTIKEKKQKCDPISINPQFLLVLLQKEQSLIEDQSPTQRQLDWATGYGCPDSQPCNTRWQGFGKQVNSASLQFYDYIVNPRYYTYKAGHTYTLSNTGKPDSVVTPQNQATAALYNYTPHVYNGNFNFFKLWLRYFTRNYPNGSLLQAEDEVGVWLIQDGKKRAFLNKSALTSRYDPNKVIIVSKSDLDKYVTGDPIKFSQYSLVRSPSGTVYLIIDDKKRGVASQEAFRTIGFNPEEVIDASLDDLSIYKEGAPITAEESYPTGALLQNKTTGGVYWAQEGKKSPLYDAIFLKTKFKNRPIYPTDSVILDGYETAPAVRFGDGELLKSETSNGVYVIDEQRKRAITSAEIFLNLGYKWENIITVPDKILALYIRGKAITEIYSEEDIEIEILETEKEDTAFSTEDMIDIEDEVSTSTDEIDEELEEEIDNILNP